MSFPYWPGGERCVAGAESEVNGVVTPRWGPLFKGVCKLY